MPTQLYNFRLYKHGKATSKVHLMTQKEADDRNRSHRKWKTGKEWRKE